ncbi:phage baseplate assembly protein V [Mediterraneibacter agrestimuris]|uniref:phage baseplate assembly protein V n=1 Tax=Mediterraneibacter agrestimuris TaxID=2941333 RepID=UPI00203FCF3A|nr:phage baseplate assembly protein V [Mediterraneibacter agrestimuris]
MSILDSISELAADQIQKTGQERISGIVIGVVAENYSEAYPGQIKVEIPVRDESANVLKWAKVVFPYTGAGWGIYFLPEKDDQVILAFENGSIDRPFVIGSIPREKDKQLTKSADERNRIKQIVTRNGSRITMEDGEDENGGKDRIILSTAEKELMLLLDNENDTIEISDKKGNSQIKMNVEEGSIVIRADKKITLQAGDSAKLVLNGENNSLKGLADKIQMKGSRALECKSDGSSKFTGQQIVIEAAASLKCSSSGMAVLSGTPVKIG